METDAGTGRLNVADADISAADKTSTEITADAAGPNGSCRVAVGC